MESHGECGLAQIGLRRTRRDLADDDNQNDVRLPRIVAGRDALVGEVHAHCIKHCMITGILSEIGQTLHDYRDFE